METTIEAPVKTFIHVAEVWVPEGGVLKHKSGIYSNMPDFEEASVKESFALGEGLPGKAWSEKRPVVLKEFDGSYFKRTEAAKAAGLTCAVAVPIFEGEALKAVLVVLCGDDADHTGAIEVWAQKGKELALMDGYYGTAADFEAVSQDVSFSRGIGLPGVVWGSQTPILMRDLGSLYGFVRSESASKTGLKHGLGLPVSVPSEADYVLTLLSSEETPIAKRFEIWDARPSTVGSEKRAMRKDGFCAIKGPLWPKENPPTDAVYVGAWQGPVGQVVGSGLPYVQEGGAGLPEGYSSMIGIPVYNGRDLTYVIAWYL